MRTYSLCPGGTAAAEGLWVWQEAFTLAHSKALQQLKDVLRFMEQAGAATNALVIDGKALTHALAADAKQLLLEVRGGSLTRVPAPQDGLPQYQAGYYLVAGCTDHCVRHQ